MFNFFSKDVFDGWDAKTMLDIGYVSGVVPIESEDFFTDEMKKGKKYALLSDLRSGFRVQYLVNVVKITGTGGTVRNVPYMFSTFGASGGFSGGIPAPGYGVLVAYVGEYKYPIAIGGLGTSMLNKVATGYLPLMRPGEHFIQSEIPRDAFSKNLKTIRRPGAYAYFDYKGRLILHSEQDDDTSNGKVTITLGNPVLDETADEDESFVAVDNATGKKIVFRLETESGVVYNIDEDGNVIESILKDYIKSVVNETLTLSGNRTETIDGDEKKSVGKTYQLTNNDIRLGGEDVDQQLVLGNVWASLMKQLFNAIKLMTHKHPQGPTIPGPVNQAQFDAIESKLDTALSEIAKTKKK